MKENTIVIPKVGSFHIEGLSHCLQTCSELTALSRELHLDFDDLRKSFLKDRDTTALSPQHYRILQAAKAEFEKVQSEIHHEVYKEISKIIDFADKQP